MTFTLVCKMIKAGNSHFGVNWVIMTTYYYYPKPNHLIFFVFNSRRESLASFVSDNESILSSAGKKKSKRSRK